MFPSPHPTITRFSKASPQNTASVVYILFIGFIDLKISNAFIYLSAAPVIQ
jgi:hypothetical protein